MRAAFLFPLSSPVRIEVEIKSGYLNWVQIKFFTHVDLNTTLVTFFSTSQHWSGCPGSRLAKENSSWGFVLMICMLFSM